MLEKKKKLTKKQIKQDGLVYTYYKAYEYFEHNRSQILIAAGAIAVVIALIFVYHSNQKNNNLIAGDQLARVMPLYDQAQYQLAIDGQPGTELTGLKSIVDEYGSTEQGEIAKIYLANSLYNTGKVDEALDVYESYSGDIPLHKATALAGVAACLISLNKNLEAAENYEKAAFVNKFNPLNADYLLKAGIQYKKAGKDNEAKEMFEMIKSDYTASNASREADKFLSSIN